jgi:dsDNA-specific endonuclease/ATPase MutS2
MSEYLDEEHVEIPINGILDLHPFSPKDLKTLIPDYIDECQIRSIHEIRFIHGKGIGNIRRSVHSLLEKNHKVKRFSLAGNEAGGWGATIVEIFPKE